MLAIAGAMFGWSIALYSIIYQFCSTQVIQWLYKRYKKETLFIISDKSDEIYQIIKETTHHDATLFKGVGCYEGRGKDTSLLCNSFRGNKTAYTAYTKC